jgi:hypothetical protein
MKRQRVYVIALSVVFALGLVHVTRQKFEHDTSIYNSKRVRAEETSAATARTTSWVDEPSALDQYVMHDKVNHGSRLRVSSVLEIQALADGGDAQAQRVLSEMYSDCQMYSLDHAAFVFYVRSISGGREDLPPRAAMMLRDLVDVCDQLDGGEPIPGNAAKEWRALAARNGDAIALAQDLYMRFDDIKPDEMAGFVDLLIANGDANALLELSNLMARPVALGDNIDPRLSGSQSATASWAIAACRRGASCAPNSRIMRQLCLFNGICDSPSFEDFVINSMVTPMGRKEIEENVNLINGMLARKGN